MPEYFPSMHEIECDKRANRIENSWYDSYIASR
jgi:hypothetical protein